ncbi:MAG TPA: alpha/beta fold hydrolase [Solirubrobacteraceae bacterium]|nr:alpha/beta fold hydrolase [Solirubrobacteraceae bacterium]
MRRPVRTLAATILASVICAAASSSAAQAQVVWKPCGDTNDVACGHLTVPLDPSGATPGTITLAMRRHRSPVGESKDAVIALAGGPGQAAIPFLSDFAELLGPIVSTRDLIAFDQRGTGLSHPLSCPAFEHLTGAGSPGAVAVCAGQIGPTRGLYTTADTVADIEAIRQAAGYEKLVLYGTSYGTKVAERYAQEYPSHVEALVLDSVVPPSGPEPFDETSFAAVGRVLRQLCGGGACGHITPEPVRDLARLVKRLSHGPVRGRVIDGEGAAHTTLVSSDDLIGILVAGDLDPVLRSEFPAAVRSAVAGDTAALARLIARAEDEPEAEEAQLSEGFDSPLYYSTICDETAFPWSRTASPKTRMLDALAALRSQPASVFAPFTAVNALALSDIPVCADWPFTPGGPEVDQTPLPDVPTLILSGADDLRTPTANARQVAAQIPDAHLLVVPNTGHSVLGSDPTSCAQKALQAQFAGRPVRQCKDRRPPALLLPTPLPPRKLADVPPERGERGTTGRTVGAVLLTLADFERQIELALLEHSGESLLESPSVSTGGLRAGWGATAHGRLVLHGYSYVPGVTVSGDLSSSGATLRIGGSAAVHGTIRIDARGLLSGELAGMRVHAGAIRATKLGASATASALQPRLSELLASTARLVDVRTDGASALLRYLLGARS